MPGGLLAGLGQGLQAASRTVGDHQELRRQQELQRQRAEEFRLSHDLAKRAEARATNEGQFNQMMGSYNAGLAGERLGIDRRRVENEESFNRNRLGLDYLKLDAENQDRDALLPAQIDELRSRAGYYREGGSGGGQARFYDIQRLIAAAESDRKRLDEITNPLFGYMTTDPDKKRELDAEAAMLRQSIMDIRNKIRESLLPGADPLSFDLATRAREPNASSLQRPPSLRDFFQLPGSR